MLGASTVDSFTKAGDNLGQLAMADEVGAELFKRLRPVAVSGRSLSKFFGAALILSPLDLPLTMTFSRLAGIDRHLLDLLDRAEELVFDARCDGVVKGQGIVGARPDFEAQAFGRYIVVLGVAPPLVACFVREFLLGRYMINALLLHPQADHRCGVACVDREEIRLRRDPLLASVPRIGLEG